MSKHFNWCRLAPFVATCISLALFGSSVAGASDINPLKPVDTSSPRATVKSFLDAIDRTEKAYAGYYATQTSGTQDLARREANKLLRMLDLSEIAPSLRADAGRDAVVFLVDIIKRLDPPNLEAIPGDAAVRAKDGPSKWRFPETELVIARVDKGPRTGEYLFAPETIERAGEFFELIAGFPVKLKTRFASWNILHTQDHGWLIPRALVDLITLPSPPSRHNCLIGLRKASMAGENNGTQCGAVSEGLEFRRVHAALWHGGAVSRGVDCDALAGRFPMSEVRWSQTQLRDGAAHLPVLGLSCADLGESRHDLPQIIDAAHQVVPRHASHNERQERHRKP